MKITSRRNFVRISFIYISLVFYSCKDLPSPIPSDGFEGKWEITWLYTTAPYTDIIEIIKVSDKRVEGSYGGNLRLEGTIEDNLLWRAEEYQNGIEIGNYELKLITPDSMFGSFFRSEMDNGELKGIRQ